MVSETLRTAVSPSAMPFSFITEKNLLMLLPSIIYDNFI
jgi:hypothetical protein